MKRISFFTLLTMLFFCNVATYAYDFEVDGIYYDVISLSDLTASVTTGDKEYEGDVVIPSHVTYRSKDFTVTTCNLSNFLKVNSLTIPKTVTNIVCRPWECGNFKGKVCLSTKTALTTIANATPTEIVTLMPDYSDDIIDFSGNYNIKRLNILTSTPVTLSSINNFNHQQIMNLEVRVQKEELANYKESNWRYFWNLDSYNEQEAVESKITKQYYDFEVNGILYSVIDMETDNLEVELTHDGIKSAQMILCWNSAQADHTYTFSKYHGDLIIPEAVKYKGKEFKVTRVGSHAFIGSQITSLSLPSTINSFSIANTFAVNRTIGYDTICIDGVWGQRDEFIGPFVGCDKLEKLTIGNSYVFEYYTNHAKEYNSNYIDRHIRSSGDGIKEITIQSSYDDLYPIIFSYDDYSNKRSTFPDLKKLTCLCFPPKNMKDFTQDQYINLEVSVPEVYYEQYMNADVWKEFWNLTAMKSVKSVTFDAQDITLKPNEKRQLHATVLPADAFNQELIWSSLNPDVAEVDNEGNVTGKKKGDAVIVATTTDGSNLSAICDVHVDCRVESIKLNTNKIMLEPSKTYRLSATVLPTDAFVKDVVWKSMDESIASVDAQGNVTANAIGKTDIIVSTTDGSNLADICEVTVMNMSNIEVDGIYYKVGTDGAMVTSNPEGTKYSGAIEIPSNINVPELGTINVISVDANAFKNATLLTKIALPATIESIEQGAFSGCTSLGFVGIENGSKMSANLDDVFAGLNVKELYLGSDNISFSNNSKLLSGLKSIVIGNSVTKLPDVAVCNNNLVRFVVESGDNVILEPSDYCSKSYKQTYSNTIKSNSIYYSFGYLVTITHLKPLADLMENKTIKHIFIGREVEGLDIEKPTYETKPTSAGSTYQGYGFKDEFHYQYQELIAKTTYSETALTSIVLNKTNASLSIGSSLQLSVNNNPSSVPSTDAIKWSSSDESIAKVNVFGKVTMIGEGTATITAQTIDGTNLSASCLINGTSTAIANRQSDYDYEYNVSTLNGIRVMNTASESSLNSLPKGIYIVNGKKMVVK